jgi:hypothetical protein
VITWQDFILDDVCGPVLNFDETSRAVDRAPVRRDRSGENLQSCRRTRLGSPSIMEDAGDIIQETRQENRPARMVGFSSPESSSSQPSMEAGLGDRVENLRWRGEV